MFRGNRANIPHLSSHHLHCGLIGRAGASPPSRATGGFFSDGPCHIPYRSKCFYIRASILAYTQQFHWSRPVRLAVFVTVNSRAPCLLTPYTHFDHRQLRPFLVLERNQLLPRFASTNNHAMRFLQWIMSIQLGTVPLCVVVCIPVRVGSFVRVALRHGLYMCTTSDIQSM